MLSEEERAALVGHLGLSRSFADVAGSAGLGAGSGRRDEAEESQMGAGDALMEPFGIRIPAATVAALMIQATQRGDVPLLADILSLMFGNYSRDRIARVQSAAAASGLAR
jgi:hypothetical protein